MTRLLLTGAGLHGAFGGLAETAAALAAGASAVAAQRVAASPALPEPPGAPAAPFDLRPWLRQRKLAKYMSRAAELAVLAAGRALADAGLLGPDFLAADPDAGAAARAEAALYVATGLMALDPAQVTDILAASVGEDGRFDLEQMGRRGLRACHPLLPFKLLLNMPLGLVSIAYGIRSENATFYPDAAQTGAAFEIAARGVRAGRVPRALVGGSAHGLSLMPLLTWRRRGWLAADAAAACPGAPGRRGWAAADAGAFVVLEADDAAAARGAQALAAVAGVAVGRAASAGPAARWAVEDRLWADAAGPDPRSAPDAVWTTGALDEADDRAEQDRAARLWPGRAVPLVNHDGRLGHATAAALPATVALAAHTLAREGGPRALLVAASQPDGGAAAVLLRAVRSPAEGGA